MLCYLTSLAAALSVVFVARHEAVYINSSRQLNEELKSLSDDDGVHNTELELNGSIQYNLTNEGFTYLSNKTLTIKSIDDQVATVSCGNGTPSTTATNGIAFANCSIKFIRVGFKRCGAHVLTLPTTATDILNSTTTPLYYPPSYASTLVFIESRVEMIRVVIEHSFGFGIIGYNLDSSRFQYIIIRNSSWSSVNDTSGPGCGMLIHFSNSLYEPTVRNISLHNATFENNQELFKGKKCISNRYVYVNTRRPNKLYNAAGLTVIYTPSRSYKANVEINMATFQTQHWQVFWRSLDNSLP